MADMAAQIGPRQLRQLTIPGTHDSGTYSLPISSIPGAWDNARTQSQTIWQQLTAGIRYLDLRLKVSDGQLCIFHGAYGGSIGYAGATISDIIGDVAGFTAACPKEIVILDFQAFDSSVTDMFHTDLAAQLALRLSLIPSPSASSPATGNPCPGQTGVVSGQSFELTVNDIWQAPPRVICLYQDVGVTLPESFFTTGQQAGLLWRRSQSVTSCWADTSDLDTLHDYMRGVTQAGSTPWFSVWQGLLTPPVVFPGSAMDYALRGNYSIGEWFNNWNPRRFNIVIFDWFQSSALVDLVLRQRGGLLLARQNADSGLPFGFTDVKASLIAKGFPDIGPTFAVACAAFPPASLQIFVSDASDSLWQTTYVTGDGTWSGAFSPINTFNLSSESASLTQILGAVTSFASAISPAGDRHICTITPATTGAGPLRYMRQAQDGSWPVWPTMIYAQAVHVACAVRSISATVGELYICLVDPEWNLWLAVCPDAALASPTTQSVTFSKIPNSPGLCPYVACAMDSVNGDLHVATLDDRGTLWHNIRATDGSWRGAFANVQAKNAATLNVGALSHLACALDATRKLHICVVDQSGQVWQTIRRLDGSWTPLWSLGLTQPATRIACAIANDDLIVIAAVANTKGPTWAQLPGGGGSVSPNTPFTLAVGGTHLYGLFQSTGAAAIVKRYVDESNSWRDAPTVEIFSGKQYLYAGNRTALYVLGTDLQCVWQVTAGASMGDESFQIADSSSVEMDGNPVITPTMTALVAGGGQSYVVTTKPSLIRRYTQVSTTWELLQTAVDGVPDHFGDTIQAVANNVGLYRLASTKADLGPAITLSVQFFDQVFSSWWTIDDKSTAGSLVAAGNHVYAIQSAPPYNIIRYDRSSGRVDHNRTVISGGTANASYVATDMMLYMLSDPQTLKRFDGTNWTNIWGQSQQAWGPIAQIVATDEVLYVLTGGKTPGVFKLA